MGWERRRQGTFYYRSTRIGSRVRKTYFGNGALANLIAHQDELQKDVRGAAAERRREARQQLESVDETLDQLGVVVDELAAMKQEVEDDAKDQKKR